MSVAELIKRYDDMIREKKEILGALQRGEIRTRRGPRLEDDTTDESIALLERQIAEITASKTDLQNANPNVR